MNVTLFKLRDIKDKVYTNSESRNTDSLFLETELLTFLSNLDLKV
jgi:hypothetical protein